MKSQVARGFVAACAFFGVSSAVLVAAPTPSSGGTVSGARHQAPQGVRMRYEGTPYDSIMKPTPPPTTMAMVEWGMTPKQVAGLLGAKCDVTGEGSCRPSGWTTDMGDLYTAGPPTLEFHGDRLYRYATLFSADDVEAFAKIFTKAMGTPVDSHEVPVQDGLGAKWNGYIGAWRAGTVEVELAARLARTTGALMRITYTALAPPKKRPEGRSPFEPPPVTDRQPDSKPETQLTAPQVSTTIQPESDSPSSPDDDEILRVGGEVTPPLLDSRVEPIYPEEARAALVQGIVILEAVIGRAGDIRSVRVLKGLPMGLDQAAIDAVQQWSFKPATRAGRPVSVYFILTVNFKS
jgi:TonB family protein